MRGVSAQGRNQGSDANLGVATGCRPESTTLVQETSPSRQPGTISIARLYGGSAMRTRCPGKITKDFHVVGESADKSINRSAIPTIGLLQTIGCGKRIWLDCAAVEALRSFPRKPATVFSPRTGNKEKSQVPAHLALKISTSVLNRSLVVTPFSVANSFLPSCAEAIRFQPKQRQGASMLHPRPEQLSDVFQLPILLPSPKNRPRSFGS